MWPIWRIVKEAHMPLSEVEQWSLDDVRQFTAVLDMGKAYTEAHDGYVMVEEERMKKERE